MPVRCNLASEALRGRSVLTSMLRKLVSRTVMARLYSLTYVIVGASTLKLWKHVWLL
jgi:hypothetical protein